MDPAYILLYPWPESNQHALRASHFECDVATITPHGLYSILLCAPSRNRTSMTVRSEHFKCSVSTYSTIGANTTYLHYTSFCVCVYRFLYLMLYKLELMSDSWGITNKDFQVYYLMSHRLCVQVQSDIFL